MKMGRLLVVLGLVLLMGLLGLFAWGVSPGIVRGEPNALFHFEARSTEKEVVIRDLASEGRLDSPLLMKLYAWLLAPTATIEPRSHLLRGGISARELVQRLAGLGSRPHASVTFPEGWTHAAMARRLEEAEICSALGFEAAVFDDVLLEDLNLLGPSAEGYLFPARYEFLVDTDPRQVVRRMVTEAKKRFSALKKTTTIDGDLKKAGLDEHKVFILASIVEKETSRAQEAPRVARVFLNRLMFPAGETKGRLQSDPTAAYGCLVDPTPAPSCQDFEQLIRPEMLDDRKNSYNTYRHAGLPPGPISNPGERALSAVLAPASGSDLYFVADGTGAHTFSVTYAEHQKAVEELRAQKKLNHAE